MVKHDIVLHASTTASSSSAMLEQARHSTHDTAHEVTSRHDSQDMSCLSCRGSGIWAYTAHIPGRILTQNSRKDSNDMYLSV